MPTPLTPVQAPAPDRPVSAQAGLTTGDLARALGVSPATIRSWERRYGIGPAQRTPGRHRRWSPRDVAVLETMCRLTARGVIPAEAARLAVAEPERLAVAEPERLAGPERLAEPEHLGASHPVAAPEQPARREPSGPGAPAAVPRQGGDRAVPAAVARRECRGLARAATRLDACEVARILDRGLDRLGLVAAWTQLMVPALRAVGRAWVTEGEPYVEVEHLLSWHISRALHRSTARCEPLPGPALLLAGMPTDLHALPLEALAAGLAERGLPYRMFGPALPPEALLAAVRRTGPPAVLLWSQLARTADRALVQRVARTSWGLHGARGRPVVLVAGPGWGGPRRPSGTLRPRDLPSALDQLGVAWKARER